MSIALHKQARTTPAVRAEIAASRESVAALARRYNVTEATIRKWCARDDFHDRPHTAHRLQTRLTPAQEAIAVYLRRNLLLSLDDLLAVMREFVCPSVSRSGLDRCLRRHGVGNLRNLLPPPVEAKGQVLQHNIFLALLHYRTASPFCSGPASTPHRARSGSCRPDRLRAR